MLQNEPQIDYHIYKSYQVLGMVGKGTYGQVYKVKNKKTQEIFAIKKICDAYQNITDAKRTYRQLNYLFQLSHPSIVKLYHVIPGFKKNYAPIRQSNTTRTDFLKNIHNQNHFGYNTQKTHDGTNNNAKHNKHVYAVFQFVQTDLSKALKRCKLESIQRKYIAYQVLQGISYLHKSKLIHRDIKPSNILIDTNCDIKICDFGLCRLKQQKSQSQFQQNIITEYVASRWYRPPQILLGFSPCDQAIDIWGVGCVIAELILRSPIFPGQSTMDQLQKIFRVIGLPNQKQISKLQSEHAKFLLRTFTFSRKNRPQKINQILNQASDQQLDLVEKLLKFNPNERLSAQEALKHKYFKQIKQMNHNFDMYNYPVKIVDYSQPSNFLKDFKTFQINERQQQKHTMKKKQMSIQQYQSLIQDLERATSRSSNRINNEQIFKKKDQIIQNQQNYSITGSEREKQQKSTRQSNFLLQHKRLQKQKAKYQIKQTDKIIQNYNKQKSCSSSQKNLHLIEIVKNERNIQSTMDNYYSSTLNSQPQASHYNFISHNQLLLGNHQRQQVNKNKFNKSMQDNLEQQYEAYFNPFQKQLKKSTNKILSKNKKSNQMGVSFQNINVKKARKPSTNKSSSKLTGAKQQKSSGKNSSKHSNHMPTQYLDENKNKYNSFKSLNSTQINNAYKIPSKIPLHKKMNNQTQGKSIKQGSKSKYTQGLKQINRENQISNNQASITQHTRQRKKSKQIVSNKIKDAKELLKNKNVANQIRQKKSSEQTAILETNQKSIDKIKKRTLQSHKILQKSTDLQKKRTLQKKSSNHVINKSLGKKKSQSKPIINNK